MRDGQLVSPDAVRLWEAAGCPGELNQVCPQKFRASLAPHLSARADGQRVDPQLLRDGIRFWQETCDIVLVEGAGGLMSPVSDDDYNADLAAEFGYPLLVVSANVLGTINATLQTLITASTYGRAGSHPEGTRPRAGSEGDKWLHVAGVVLNSATMSSDEPSTDSNADELARRCVPPLLATVAHGGGFDRDVDWSTIARRTD
jgi:dethiobiotin synthetase